MRTAILLLSTASLLAACSESADSTAPRSPAIRAAVAAPNAQASEVGPISNAKPASGPTVTYLTSSYAKIDGVAWIANTAYVTCPAGTSIVGGGYEFEYGFMTSRIRYNGPVGTNIWKVLVYGEGASQASFRAFGTCVG